MELLNLSRTCKIFRKVLMTEDSSTVWRTARMNLGVPDCPPDLTEWGYADLLFCRGNCYVYLSRC